ncbi:hypothetical protein TNCV_1378391 [Trichonephila clavipes]|nr:hypothetical protein TNCV_1378391 [Trichonephila clavipes]
MDAEIREKMTALKKKKKPLGSKNSGFGVRFDRLPQYSPYLAPLDFLVSKFVTEKCFACNGPQMNVFSLPDTSGKEYRCWRETRWTKRVEVKGDYAEK